MWDSNLMAQCRSEEGKARRTCIRTTNLGLASEYAFGETAWNLELELAGGHVSPTLFAVYGPSADEFARDHARNCFCSVLAVNALLANSGVYGVDAETLSTKREVMANPFQRLVIVADHTKLALLPSDSKCGFSAFPQSAQWMQLAQKENFFVYTTRYPDVRPNEWDNVAELPLNTPEDRLTGQTPAFRYAFQAFHLRRLMHDRFVELDAVSGDVLA